LFHRAFHIYDTPYWGGSSGGRRKNGSMGEAKPWQESDYNYDTTMPSIGDYGDYGQPEPGEDYYNYDTTMPSIGDYGDYGEDSGKDSSGDYWTTNDYGKGSGEDNGGSDYDYGNGSGEDYDEKSGEDFGKGSGEDNWEGSDYEDNDESLAMDNKPSLERLQKMNIDELIVAITWMDARHMQKIMQQNSAAVKSLMAKFTKKEQQSIMTTIGMKKKTMESSSTPNKPSSGSGSRPNTGSGSGSSEKPPRLNANASVTDLVEALGNLTMDEVENEMSNMDSDTQWDMFEKIKGTKYGKMLEDQIYDDDNYDEEESSWAGIFDDDELFRKKRSVGGRGIVRKSGGRMAKAGGNSGSSSSTTSSSSTSSSTSGFGDIFKMLGGAEKDMKKGAKMNFMAAMSLQGLLMMDNSDMSSGTPIIIREIPMCLKQILWSPDKTGKGLICSWLTGKMKKSLREIMMLVLRKDIIPDIISEMDWMSYAGIAAQSGINKDLLKLATAKMMIPLEGNDLKELLKPITTLYNDILISEKDSKKKNILKLIGGLLDAVNNDKVLDQLADIAQDIQGIVLLKKYLPLISGQPGPKPKKADLCLAFAQHSLQQENGKSPQKRKQLTPPTTWITKGQAVYKTEFNELNNQWLYTKVAMCSYPKKQHRREQGSGSGSGWDHGSWSGSGSG